MKKVIGLILCLTFFQKTYTKNITQISIPKSGTHMLMKAIISITRRENAKGTGHGPWRIVKPSFFAKKTQHAKHWITHAIYNKEFEPFLNNKESAIFFIYRDPRDQIISSAHFILSYPHHPYRAEGKLFSFDDLISALIQTSNFYKYHGFPCDNISDLYQHYMPWLSAPHICVIQFEDLIGPRGGGNSEKQFETIKKMASHMGIAISDKRIKNVAHNLFGGTDTFRKGQIGAWKLHFKEHHKEAFKEIAGQLLIDLGYEKNFNW